jgi:hypothetical protein
MTITPPPTQAGYLTFIRSSMGINTTVLPDSSDAISTSYQIAVELANILMNSISPVIYTVMVYNLAGAILIDVAQDVGGPPPPVYKEGLPYFQYLRSSFGLSSFVGGTISSTGDEGTSESLNVPHNLQNLTLADLQLLRTPWGRTYLQYAEKYGTIVGLS